MTAAAIPLRAALECARQAIEYSIDMGGTDPAGVLLQALNKADAALASEPVAGGVREARDAMAVCPYWNGEKSLSAPPAPAGREAELAAREIDAEFARISGLYFDALNEITELKAALALPPHDGGAK